MKTNLPSLSFQTRELWGVFIQSQITPSLVVKISLFGVKIMYSFSFSFKDDAFYCVDIGDILIKHYKVFGIYFITRG